MKHTMIHILIKILDICPHSYICCATGSWEREGRGAFLSKVSMCQVRLLLCTNLKGDSHENFIPSLLFICTFLKGQCHEGQKYVQLSIGAL
jgi:hypothetical protein